METLLSYDFDVVYVPGILNILSDKLSRIFQTTMELEGGDELSQSHTLQKKRKLDKEKEKKKNIKVFYIQNPKKFTDKGYIIPEEKDRKDILDEAHKFGHFGADHIVKHIHNLDMHWPNLLADAVQYVSQCPTCQKYNVHKRGYNPQKPVYSYMPGDSYAMDLAGPFKSNAGQYTYLLIVVDIYNGTEFKNELINNMFKLMAIDKRYITAYHPASNLSERFVQSTKKVLAKIMEGNGEDWHYYVPAVQLMLNNKVFKRLNSTPFSLMFARRMNDFIRYDDKGESKEKSYMTHEELVNRIDYMSNIIFLAIAERTKAYTDIQKGIADKKHRVIDYPEGSYVMVRVRDRYNNLSPAYQGPYSVVRKTTGGSYVLKDEEELKLISQEEIIPEDELYVIEAIIDHRGEPGR
ncbi:hypothetical protein G6F57_015383 [Rhizopus arrhizus]|nr:hypothetical protein G6F57_015383 [Rhizopus arrhizus]